MMGFEERTKNTEKETITSLSDKRLIKIDPQEKGFFDAVLGVATDNKKLNDFIEAVARIKEVQLTAFYRPVYDPSEVENHLVTYQFGREPAIDHSYNWWLETASKMSAVEGKNWHIATEYQYYAFLVWLINQLVRNGKSVEDALNMVVLDSKELGNYYDSDGSPHGLEKTGSRCVAGMYDLANACKYVACSDKETGGFWLCGGVWNAKGDFYPLAGLGHLKDVDLGYHRCLGLLVLY